MSRIVAALLAVAVASVLVPTGAGQVTNSEPYADAYDDMVVPSGPYTLPLDANINVDGIPPGTYDQNLDPITCKWFVSGPTVPSGGPAMTVGNPTLCTPGTTFASLSIPSVAGLPYRTYTYQVTLFVNDGLTTARTQPDAAHGITCDDSNNNWYPTRMCDRFKVTVSEAASPPQLPAVFTVAPNQSMDLVTRRCCSVDVIVNGVQDDYRTASMEVTFSGPATIVWPMEKVSPGPQAPTTSPEVSRWEAHIPATDPQWRVGEYAVWVTAVDNDGLVSESSHEDFTYEVVNEIDTIGAFDVRVIQAGMVTAPFSGQACGPSLPATEGYSLGHGLTMRLNVSLPYVNPETLPGVPADLFEGKITVQSIRTDPVTGRVFTSPPQEIQRPYYFALSSLDFVDQALLIHGEDRLGNTKDLCVWLAVDTDAPFWMPEVPKQTYQGIPFSIAVYTRDTTQTIATLRIDLWNETSALTSSIDGSSTTVEENQTLFRMPALGIGRDAFVSNILSPTYSPFQPCDIVLDLFQPFGLGSFDAVFQPATHEIHKIVVVDINDNDVATYGVDLDDNGVYDPADPEAGRAVAEPIIRAGLVTQYPFLDEKRCADPFADAPEVRDFLTQGPSQMFAWRLVRNTTGFAETTITLQDLTANRAATDYTYRYALPLGGYGDVEITNRDLFYTGQAEVDAQVARDDNTGDVYAGAGGVLAETGECPNALEQLTEDRKPLLPGDKVCILGGVKYTTELDPKPVTQLAYGIFGPPFVGVGGAEGIYAFTIGSPLLGEVALISNENHTLPPGVNRIVIAVSAEDFVTDSSEGNNAEELQVEVYAGKVIVQSGPGAGTYWIRAESPGKYLTEGGVVTLNDDGSIDEEFDLSENQTVVLQDGVIVGSRYIFKVPTGGANNETRTLYWDPQARTDPGTLEPCTGTQASQLASCRPITVLGAPAAVEKGKKSPGPEMVLVLVGLAGLAFALRRRAAA